MKLKLATLTVVLAGALGASPITVAGSGSFGCDPQGSEYNLHFDGAGVSAAANGIYSPGCPFSLLTSDLSGFVRGTGEAQIGDVASSWFGFTLGLAGASLTLFDEHARALAHADLDGYIEIADYHASGFMRESYGAFSVTGGHDEHPSAVPEPSYFWIGGGVIWLLWVVRTLRKKA